MFATLISTSICIYIAHKVYYPDLLPNLNKLQYVSPIIAILSRVATIGVKYGQYSDEHIYIINKLKLSLKFLNSSLVVSRLQNDDPYEIMLRIKKSLNELQIDEGTF